MATVSSTTGFGIAAQLAHHIESRRRHGAAHQGLQPVAGDLELGFGLADGGLELQRSHLRPHQFHLGQIAGAHPGRVHLHDAAEGLQILPRQRQIVLGLQHVDEGILHIQHQRAGGIQQLQLRHFARGLRHFDAPLALGRRARE